MKQQKIITTEAQLQRAVLERLAWTQGIYYLRNNSVCGQFKRSNGSYGWVNNAKKGSPDIILCKNGLWIGLELKTETGKLSYEQKQAEKDIRLAGGHYFVVRNLDELESILDNF